VAGGFAGQGFLEFGELGFKGIVVFPVGKIGDVVGANFFGQILASDRISTGPFVEDSEISEPDGKEFAAVFLFLLGAGFADFSHHPFAEDAVFELWISIVLFVFQVINLDQPIQPIEPVRSGQNPRQIKFKSTKPCFSSVFACLWHRLEMLCQNTGEPFRRPSN